MCRAACQSTETDCLSLVEFRNEFLPATIILPETEVRIALAFDTYAYPCGQLGLSLLPAAIYDVVIANGRLPGGQEPSRRWRQPPHSMLCGDFPEFIARIGHSVCIKLARRYPAEPPSDIEAAVSVGLKLLYRPPDDSGHGVYANYRPRLGASLFHYAAKAVVREAVRALNTDRIKWRAEYPCEDVAGVGERKHIERHEWQDPEELHEGDDELSAVVRAIMWENHVWDPTTGLMVSVFNRLVGHRPGMRPRKFSPGDARILMAISGIFRGNPLLFPTSMGGGLSCTAVARLADCGKNSGRLSISVLKILEFELTRSCGQPSGVSAPPDRIPEILDLLAELIDALRELERRYASAERELTDENGKTQEMNMLHKKSERDWRCRIFGIVQVSDLEKLLNNFR
ncbi:hypothetical protein [Erythrobacter aureus]|uniref:hypothetical protein n=1 Tax=Erythrobacter aureus TaxID=2182384 RepID=UPI003A905781